MIQCEIQVKCEISRFYSDNLKFRQVSLVLYIYFDEMDFEVNHFKVSYILITKILNSMFWTNTESQDLFKEVIRGVFILFFCSIYNAILFKHISNHL